MQADSFITYNYLNLTNILEFKIVRTYSNPDSAEKTFQSH